MADQGAVVAADTLRLEPLRGLDATTVLPVDVANLPRGLHVNGMCFHPQRPIIALGVQNYVGAYDMLSGARLGREEFRTPAVRMMFTPDGSQLLLATQDWHIIGMQSYSWKKRAVALCRVPRSGPLEDILMAVTGGSKPMVFFTRRGKDSIRMAYAVGRHESASKKLTNKNKWGLKLKLDQERKPVIGLGASRDNQVLVMQADGVLKSYAITSAGLTPVYALPVDPLGARTGAVGSHLEAFAHPFTPAGSILVHGSGQGSIIVLELAGKSEPRVLLRSTTPDNMPVVGVGMHLPSRTLMVFSAAAGGGGLAAKAWQLCHRGAKATTAVPVSVELGSLDTDMAGAAQLMPANGGAQPAASGKKSKRAAAESSAPSWQQLWAGGGGTDDFSTSEDNSMLLAKLLDPVVSGVAVHPLLGAVAVQRAPPPALRQAPAIMMQHIGTISPAEAAISRKTATLPMLRVVNDGQPRGYWPGGGAAPMHTGMDFWLGGSGLSAARLQFPCHLYYLAPGKLCKYGLVTKASGAFVNLPEATSSKRAHEPRYVVHSPKQHAWLVFFETTEALDVAGGEDTGPTPWQDRWHFTLVRDGMAEVTWTLPGQHGTFVGPSDASFAILPPSSSTLQVYHAATFKGKGLPAYTMDLERPSKQGGSGLWAGPPAPGVPKPGAVAAAKAAAEKERRAAERAAAAEEGKAEGGSSDDEAAAAEAAATVASKRKRRAKKPRWQRDSDDSDDGEVEAASNPMFGVATGYIDAIQHRFGPGGGQAAAQQPSPFAAMARATQQAKPPEERVSHTGGGVVIWHMAGDKLAMAGLPAAGQQPAPGDDSDDPDAVEEAAQAPSKGTLHAEYTLQLLPGERLLSVSWQTLTGDTPLEPHMTAAALLTTRRLMLVDGALRLITTTDATCGAMGVAHPITSVLWAGPALLYMTAGGQVMQLTWTGHTQLVCSVASHPPALLAGALADSLLLLRTNPVSGEREVSTRPVGLLQPLVLGWCSLAAAGLLPKGLSSARNALQTVLANFDASHITSGLLWELINAWCWDVAAALAAHGTNVDPAVQMAANAAAAKWPVVVSALVSEHEGSSYYPGPVPRGTPLHSKLLAAAAGAISHGQFASAQECLKAAGEWETALSLAVCQADFGALRQLGSGLAGAEAGLPDEKDAQDIARLARAILRAYEGQGMLHSSLATHNWTSRMVMGDGGVLVNAADWQFGSNGKQPSMEASSFNAPTAFVQDGEVGPIPRADASTLGVFLGQSDIAALGVAPSEADQSLPDLLALQPSMSQASLARSSSVASEDSAGQADGAQAAAREDFFGFGGGREEFSDDDDPFGLGEAGGLMGGGAKKLRIHIKTKEELEREAAAGGISAGPTGGSVASTADLREAAAKLKLGGPGSFKSPSKLPPPGGKPLQRKDSQLSTASDDGPFGDPLATSLSGLSLEGSPSTSGAARPTTTGGSLPPKTPPGNLTAAGLAASLAAPQAVTGLGGMAMRPKASGGGKAPAAPLPISDDDFLEALGAAPAAKYGPAVGAPPPPPSASRTSPSKQSGVTPTSSGRASAASTSKGSAAGAAAAPSASGWLGSGAGTASGSSADLFNRGVAAMERAEWRGAQDLFSQTLARLASDPPGPVRDQQRQFCAQYLAAVLLLEQAVPDAGSKGAALYRYAAALQLETERHQAMLVLEAVTRNKAFGNFKYASEQLNWLVALFLGKKPMEQMAKWQEEMDACDRKGTDATIPPGEDLATFVALVSSADSKGGVQEIVQNVIDQSR